MPRATLNQIVHNLRKAVAAHRFDGVADGDLLERFQSKSDPAAFEAIVRRYGERVLAACYKVLTDPADVEDAFQATFLVLLRDAQRIRKRQSLGGWLYGVAHRIALQARARAARRVRAEARKPTRVDETAPDLSWREACAILHEELDRLPATYRMPLLLCYLEGHSRDEAARQIGVRLDVLRGRLERGRERLRSRLVKRGITLSAGLLAAVSENVQAAVLPARLVQTTVETLATGSASATVAALIPGATTSLTLGKLKLAAVVLLAAGLISGSIHWSRQRAAVPEPNATAEPVGLVAGPSAPSRRAGKPTDPGKNRHRQPVPISGKVIGPDGRPVPNAKLVIFDAGAWKPAPQAGANADGGFAFAMPPYTEQRSLRLLVAMAPDLGLGCDWAGLGVTEPLKDVVLKLPRDEPIRGRIVDLEGRPVPDATIAITDIATGADGTLNEWVRSWSKEWEKQYNAYASLTNGRWLYVKNATSRYFGATSGADGRFTLAGIGRDRCPHLTVRAKGKATQVCIVTLRRDFRPEPGALSSARLFGPEFTLPLVPARPITGVVREATTRKPLAGIRVLGQVDLSDSRQQGFLVLPDVATTTDAEGKYALDELPLGKKYVLLATPQPGEGPLHRFAVHTDEALREGPLRADFDLPRGVVLSGQIKTQKTGKPVSAHVFYRPLWSNQSLKDHPGYESPGIAPWYTEAEGSTDTDGRFRLTVLSGTGLLHVQVRDGEYVPAKLAAEDDTEEVILHEAGMKLFRTTGQGGHFSPSFMNAYRVLRIPTDARAFSVDAAIDPGVSRVVKIIDPDGQPVSGAWVLNHRPRGGSSEPVSGAEFTVYALSTDEPRRIYAQHDARKLAGFLTLDGKETGPVILRLAPTATVTGRVVDADGRPLKDYRVRPAYEDGEIGTSLNPRDIHRTDPVSTDADGRFTLANIPAGLTVSFDARSVTGKYLGHSIAKQTLKPGQSLDLGDWKPN